MSIHTTFERAHAGFDEQNEQDLVEAIMKAIADASMVTAAALLDTQAVVLALSPSASRSPTAIQKTCDELHKRLRRRVAAAERSEDVQEFARRVFRDGDVGGQA